MKDLVGRLTSRLGLPRYQVERTVSLFEQDNTVPFIARYRKEVTGGLDEEVLANFRDELNALRKLDDRQKSVLKSIEEQGSLTPELEEAIEEADTLQQVEDLYLPYKPKRRTRAQVAREKGLEPIAEWILEQLHFDMSLEEAVAGYINDDVPSPDEAWQGARDIVAEIISDDARSRDVARRLTWDYAQLESTAGDTTQDEKGIFETYYEFGNRLNYLKPHQVLAINRGESEKVLKARIAVEPEPIITQLSGIYPPDYNSPVSDNLLLAIEDSYKRLIKPAIEREVRRDLTAWADEHAITVFATNLRNLLLTPPLKDQVVLAIDPGFRTGCKVAIIDITGKVLDTTTIYPHPPRNEWDRSIDTILEQIARYQVNLLAIGNGTASRETEELAATALNRASGDVNYLIVSEAGASVYSASKLARAELPDMDVSMRGAVSIGRRAQDPLAELVKIDPKSIGVGMYQHDVDQNALQESLDWVTQSVVNAVGVDVNTASPALLQYVAGLGPKLAEKVVNHRDKRGQFKTRESIKKVSGMGERTFEQAAGFLRISDGDNPLDKTGIHPESYPATQVLLNTLKLSLSDPDLPQKLGQAQSAYDLSKLAGELGIGDLTLRDILAELQSPGRDPREDIPAPLLRSDVLKMEDLKPGMTLKGTVRNVVDFGAFVDIGVKQNGLVHISQMADYHVDSPYDEVGVGDVIDVTILNVDLDRGRIGLSMKS